jgi:hypothetical protein
MLNPESAIGISLVRQLLPMPTTRDEYKHQIRGDVEIHNIILKPGPLTLPEKPNPPKQRM